MSLNQRQKFSASKVNHLQDAINDSAKDHIRIDESLNFIKQKLFEKGDIEQAQSVERFQSPVDMPYQETYGAAAIISDECFDAEELARIAHRSPGSGVFGRRDVAKIDR